MPGERFDLGELYAAWTEDSSVFWGQPDQNSQKFQHYQSLTPESILNEEVWADILNYACPPPFEYLEDAHVWLGFVVDGLRTWSQLAMQKSRDNEELSGCREALEKFLFLTRLHLARLDATLAEIVPVNKRAISIGPIGDQAKALLDAVSRTIQGGVSAVFPATESAKRSSLSLLYLEPSCRLLQHEIVVRDQQLSREIVRLLSLGIKLQHQQAMVRTQVIQLLTYYEHAVPVTVLLIDTLQKQFDHTSLADLVLKDIALEASEWTDAQNSGTIARAKCVNSFFQALMQAAPHLVSRNLTSISILIGSPIPQLRQAILDISAAIIHNILNPGSENEINTGASGVNDENQRELQVPTSSLRTLALAKKPGSDTNSGDNRFADDEGQKFKPVFDLVQLVELRVNDLSHFCRLRAVQVLASVAKENAFISRREKLTEIAISKMKDRTQLVRRQAMRLMKTLIDSHPQVMHPNNLSRPVWQSSLDQIEMQLESTEPGDTRQQLQAAHAFVTFTLRFLTQVDEAVEVAQTLLMSRSKSDILDAVELLVYADAYGIESSSAGIRAIVHLVWAKADNDEANTVCQTAVNTYRDLFMTAPPELDTRKGAQLVAENLIALTYGASQGELTSLERLLVIAIEQDMIEVAVVGRLWGIYQTQIRIEPAKRRGAAILLSMLSLADRSIACTGISALVDIGLSELGVADPELAAYSFSILKRSIESDASAQRLPSTYELFDKVITFLMLPSDPNNAMEWTSLAKEALAAISAMCECPPKVFTRIMREYITLVFQENESGFNSSQRMQLFAQMLFLAGEVSLNLLVYLERSELEFKKRLQSDDLKETSSKQTGGSSDVATEGDKENELMAGGGSREDDFQDVIRDIREEGILYSDRALLKPFTSLVIDICNRELKNTESKAQGGETVGKNEEISQAGSKYESQNKLLVMGATQTLSKFMCVSSQFCANNLPLLVELMGKHESNVVRSNFVVALGDVAICFNRLIDQHTEYIYDRLNDSDPVVQRTCIVALTFLILAGQIKVKGKLGEMAKAVAHHNRKISSLATMFFRELATKENAVYNSFLDMLSTLIADSSLAESDMLQILKFLSEFVDRERHMKQLTEKLLTRLPRCESQRQWNAYVQVLKSLPHKLDVNVKEIIAAGFSAIPGQDAAIDLENFNEDDDPEGGNIQLQESPDKSSRDLRAELRAF